MAAPDFWSDPERAQKTAQRASELRDAVEAFRRVERMCEDAQVLLELGREADDAETAAELENELAELDR
ncbi:MAG: Peptide chain release factor 2, partial [Clostridia bacterium 62_21]